MVKVLCPIGFWGIYIGSWAKYNGNLTNTVVCAAYMANMMKVQRRFFKNVYFELPMLVNKLKLKYSVGNRCRNPTVYRSLLSHELPTSSQSSRSSKLSTDSRLSRGSQSSRSSQPSTSSRSSRSSKSSRGSQSSKSSKSSRGSHENWPWGAQ